MSQLSAELSTGRIAITIPNFLDRLEKAEVKLRLSAELMEFVNDGQLGSLDGVCLNLAEASFPAAEAYPCSPAKPDEHASFAICSARLAPPAGKEFSSLDNLPEIFNPEVPQIERGVTVALSLPHREQKCGAFYTCHLRTPEGYGYISARRRPVSVRTGGFFRAGERSLAFFCTL